MLRSAARIRAISVSLVLPAIAFASALGDGPAAKAPTPEERLRADVGYLADDAREGRVPGSKGIEAAADHIAKRFRELGLKPAAGSNDFFQPFEIRSGARFARNPSLAFQAAKREEAFPAARANTDFRPLALGGGGTIQGGGVVFAGFGITANDAAANLHYDDYAGIDVKGKAVLILRRQPARPEGAGKPFAGMVDSRYATFRHKAVNAFQHGAAAVLLVNDRTSPEAAGDKLLPFVAGGDETFSNIPFVMITRALAGEILKAGAVDLEEIETEIDKTFEPRSKTLPGVAVDLDVAIERTTVQTKNVVGVLEGAGPHADETVVLGAHYDHLGNGGVMSGSLAFFSREIHNGADDNASGTSMLLEMARRLAARPDPPARRVVFIAFSGEERGLLGSAYYAEHPLYPLAETVAMINYDMVGRLNEKNELTVYGTGTAPGFDAIVDSLGKSAGFTIKKIADGAGPSDQDTFYRKDVPVLFLFTGTHKDYHRPSDDTALINFTGMARIADFAELLALDLIRRPARPAFVKVAAPHGSSKDVGRLAVSAYLGSIPSYGDDVKGVKLSGVREGSPAEKGGLKGGDIVIGFAGKPVATIYDYTESLGLHKPGDTVDVTVLRDGKEVRLKVTLGVKPQAPE